MARDSRLLKRNLLVVPGGLLAALATIGLLYFLAVRKSGAPCAKYTQVLMSGTCYTMTGWLAGALLVGLILIAVGLVVFRGKPAALVDHLNHGTPVHVGLAFLGSLVAIPLLAYIIVAYLERARNTHYVLSLPGSGTPPAVITLSAVLGIFLLIGLMAFIPYLLLYLAQGQLRRRFLKAAESYEEPEAFPGEPAAAAQTAEGAPWQPSATGLAADQPPPEEFVDEALWPASRDGPEVEAAPANSPDVSDEDLKAWDIATLEADDAAATTTLAAAPAAAARPVPPTVARALPRPGAKVQPAPIVRAAPGCRAMTGSGAECGEAVGPGGRYCLRHACQGRTASGTPCRNPALEGGSRCRAHSAS